MIFFKKKIEEKRKEMVNVINQKNWKGKNSYNFQRIKGGLRGVKQPSNERQPLIVSFSHHCTYRAPKIYPA